MQDESRGFNSFVGKTIVSVDTTAINVVKLTFSDGSEKEIWAETHHYGISVIEAVDSSKE